jgi:hypothetical protein
MQGRWTRAPASTHISAENGEDAAKEVPAHVLLGQKLPTSKGKSR